MNFKGAISYAESHPVPVGLGVFVIGLVVVYLFSRNSAASSDPSGQIAQANSVATSAYYAAEGQQGAAGDALQTAMVNANAAVAINGQNTGASVTNNTTWANTDLAETTSTNAAATAIAPYNTENNLISTLGTVAQQPGTVVTTQSTDDGFLGIGGGSSTSTKVVPNPAATSAATELASLETMFNPMHG